MAEVKQRRSSRSSPVAQPAAVAPAPAGGHKHQPHAPGHAAHHHKKFGAVEAYLVLYNSACMLGWLYVLVLAARSAWAAGAAKLSPAALDGVWAAAAAPLEVVQWAMCLEVAHAALRIVPSPVGTTAMQVASRVIVLVAAQRAPAAARASWFAGLLVMAWSLAEVPRYAFYLSGLTLKQVPFALFWLRYSLFAVLYPAGITGEWFTLRAAGPVLPASTLSALLGLPTGALPAAADVRVDLPVLVRWLLAAYFPLGAFMIWNMVQNRASAFKKRNARPPPPETGVVFPPDGKGTRTTTITSQRVIGAALRACGGDEAEAAAAAAEGDKNWKFSYPKHYLELVRLSAASERAASESARAGLDFCRANFEFIAAPGAAVEKLAAGAAPESARVLFGTGRVAGTGAAPAAYSVPYNGGWAPGMSLDVPKDAKNQLSGAALAARLDAWVKGGFMEPDAASAIAWTSDNFAAVKERLKKTHFVMIGAGSAMGPYKKLLEIGAHVVALDVSVAVGPFAPGLWKRLLEEAKRSPGRVTFPTSGAVTAAAEGSPEYLATVAGADVINQPAEIARWLVEWQKSVPKDDTVVIGNYTYLDGDRHVKLALACDAIILALRTARPKNTAVAFLCTPTDAHIATPAAHAASKEALGSGLGSFGLEKAANLLSGGLALIPNARKPVKGPGGADVHIVNGLSTAQSFNYALAKRIQHWRAAVEYSEGAVVSSMVAPSTATISVLSNPSFGWVYGGMPYFGFEVFKQDTTNAVMCAILLNDVLNKDSPKNPENKKAAGVNTALELFRSEAVHGGLWRSPYTLDSVGNASALIYFAGVVQPYAAAAAIAAAALQALRAAGVPVALW